MTFSWTYKKLKYWKIVDGNYLILIASKRRRLIVIISHEHMEREVGIICVTLLSDVPKATLVNKEVLYKKE